MITIKARKFLQWSTEDIWKRLKGKFLLEFDDGEVIEATHAVVKYSCPGWEFHKQFPALPLLRRHSIVDYAVDGIRSGSNISQLSEIINDIWEFVKVRPEDEDELIETICNIGYPACNKLYNMLVRHTSPWICSFDITDFYQIIHDEEIANVTETAPPTKEGVELVYSTIKRRIKDKKFEDNPVVRAVRTGAVREAQFLQLVGWRGFTSEVNQQIHPHPVRRGYLRGFKLLPDLLTTSRDNTIAQASAASPLKLTEYWSRRTQLLVSIISRLHRGDCGSTSYLGWTVEKSDLKNLVGKFYLDESSQQLKMIKPKDTHLVGQYIRLRSVFGKCTTADRRGVCATCLGALARSVPKGTNLGHWCGITMLAPITQMVLSRKHHIGSTDSTDIVLDEEHARYLKVMGGESHYWLSDKFKEYTQINLIILPIQAPYLTDLMNENVDIDNITLRHISNFATKRDAGKKKKKRSLNQAMFEVVTPEGEIEEVLLNLSHNKRDAFLSREMLKYIKLYGFSVDAKGQFVVDVTAWDYNEPMFSLPIRHFDMIDYQATVEDLLEKMPYDFTTGSYDELLRIAFDTINSKTTVNIAIVEVVLLAFLTDVTPGVLPFPPKVGGIPQKFTLRETIGMRSMSPALAFEDQKSLLTDPYQLNIDTRPDSPLDEAFVPNYV